VATNQFFKNTFKLPLTNWQFPRYNLVEGNMKKEADNEKELVFSYESGIGASHCRLGWLRPG
jgi:hypothetical protein